MAALRLRRAGRLLALAGFILVATAAVQPARAAGPSPVPAGPWYHLGDSGDVVVDLWFGWSSTCPHCARARAWLLDFAPTAPWLQVHSLQVDGPDAQANIDTLVTLATGIGKQVSAVPVFLFGGRLATGFDEPSTTGAELEAALRAYRDEVTATIGPPSPSPAGSPAAPSPAATSRTETAPVTLPFVGTVDARTLSLPLLAVVLGGLDAVNPCALSVLLFLVSALVGAHARRRILVVGGVFVLATGIVYYLLMAAWLNAFLWFGELRLVTAIAGAAAVVAGLINVKDFAWFGRGPSLVIPGSARPMIFGRLLDVSDAVAMPALLGATAVVAAVASAYEMLCTGGFPVVFTRVLTLSDLAVAEYYAYLLLYVGVYVVPMLVIVGMFAVTLGTRRVSVNEARRLKLLSGLLMLGVGALLLMAPDRLSDLAWTGGLFAGAIVLWAGAVTVDRTRQTRSQAGPTR